MLEALPFPPYAYVPGHWPHPTRDPQGHSFGRGELTCPPLDPAGDAWRNSATYLRALELFDHGYYWEAHEGLEALWIAAGREGAVADLLSGLIKVAAGAIKLRQGNVASAATLAARAIDSFDRAETTARQSKLAGLRFEELRAAAASVTRIDVSALSPMDPAGPLLAPLLEMSGGGRP